MSGTYPIVGLILWSKWSWTKRQTMLDFPTPVSWKSKRAWQWAMRSELGDPRRQYFTWFIFKNESLTLSSCLVASGAHHTFQKKSEDMSFSNTSIVSEYSWPSSQDSLLSKPSILLGGFYIPVARTAVHPAWPFACTSKPRAFQHTVHYPAEPEKQSHSGLLQGQPKQASKTE